MHVVFAGPDGKPIAEMPLKSGQPAVSDNVIMERSDGSKVIFSVLAREWFFTENADGGGVTARLRIICAPIGSQDPQKEEESDSDA